MMRCCPMTIGMRRNALRLLAPYGLRVTRVALLAAAMDFCQSRHYERVHLWTFEGLDAARHLYEKSGFRLAHQQRGTQWGAEVNEQKFERRA